MAILDTLSSYLKHPDIQSSLGLACAPRFFGRSLAVTVEDAALEGQLLEIPSETTPEERRFLCNFMAHIWSGAGSVLEIGPYLGGTTRALAAGMMKNIRRNPAARLLTFDTFEGYGTPEGFCNFLGPLFQNGSLPAALRDELIRQGKGFEFLSVFKRLHERHAYYPLLEVHKASTADLPEEVSSGKPLLKCEPTQNFEVVFVDGCKSWFGTKYFMQQMAVCTQPGAYFIFQDYRWYTCFWLSAFVCLFREYFELTAFVDSTYVFRLKQPLTAQKIAERFPDSPEGVGAEFFRQIFNSLMFEAAERQDMDAFVAHKLHLVGALAYVNAKDEAREILSALVKEPYALRYRDIIEKASKSPTYRPGEGVTL